MDVPAATAPTAPSIAGGMAGPASVGRPGLVDADWLEAHLDDPDLQVIEVDVSPAAHQAGHIPGSVLWNIYADLKDGDYRLVDPDRIEALVQRSGIDATTTLVFYGYGPAIGLWLMRCFGHRSVFLLDAGRDQWRHDGRPWTTRMTRPVPTRYCLTGPDPELRATLADVRAGLDDGRTTVVDVRSAEEFDGERFWPSGGMEPDGRAGHIPGARHLPLDGLADVGPLDERGAFRPTHQLASRYAELLDGDGEIIAYCTIGARAATAWFVLSELLGHPRTRVYDGSWAEWGRTAGLPVER